MARHHAGQTRSAPNLGGDWAQTVAVLTKMAEARGGSMIAAVAYKRLRAALERTTARADADAFIASSTHEENAFVRRNVRDREDECTLLIVLCSEE